METRILSTSIWRDTQFRKLDDKSARVVLFLLTNDKIPVLPAYQMPLDEIAFYCGTTTQKVEELIPQLPDFGILYSEGWFIISNKFTRSKYMGGKTQEKRKNLWSYLPEKLQLLIDTEGNIDQSLINDWSTYASINHKSKTINHKSKTINLKKDKKSYEEIITHFNETFGKNTKSHAAWKDNADYWLETYSLEEIKQAITNWKTAKGWLGGLDDKTLTLLFRTKNKAGACDYIDDLLNQTPSKKLSDDPLAVAARRNNGRYQ